jgi:hypothetical protein
MPVYDFERRTVTRTVENEDSPLEIVLDLSSQVLALSVPEDRGHTSEDALAPTLQKLPNQMWTIFPFVSASVLALKAKQFDDGLYAAVELAAQQGLGRFQGKERLLSKLLRSILETGSGPASLLAASATLGRWPAEVPHGVAEDAQEEVSAFLADGWRSKPLGFYTWSDDLWTIFQQDRLLQKELRRDEAEALAAVLAADGDLGTQYDRYLMLISRLTNPLAYPDLRDAMRGRPDGTRIFPPSMSHETELAKRLYGNSPIPDGFNLADTMIAEIRAGRLDLTPRDESGWYDHQTWSLEPFVVPERMPEAARLHLDESYRKVLLETFKGIIALTRETHVKQLEVPMAGMAGGWDRQTTLYIEPTLSAEPLPTYYIRRARAYRFVRRVLEDAFGEEALESMHRITADGPVRESLDRELGTMGGLFYGAYATVSAELGLTPGPLVEGASDGPPPAVHGAIDRFREWSRALDLDSDLGRDARMMVPLFFDVERGKVKVWVFLGWTSRQLDVSFATPPRLIEVRKGSKAVNVKTELTERSYQLIYPVTAEVYVDRPYDRDEFRRFCDLHRTRSAILAALG